MSEIIDYCTGGVILVPDTDQLTQHVTVQGDLLSGAESAPANMKQSRGGTISHLRVYVVSNTRGQVTVKFVTSSGLQPNPPLGVTFDDNDSGHFENTSVAPQFSAGVSFRWEIHLEKEGDEPNGITTVLGYISARIEFDE